MKSINDKHGEITVQIQMGDRKSVNEKAIEITMRLLARNEALMGALVNLIEACDGREFDDWTIGEAVVHAKQVISHNSDPAPDVKNAAAQQ